MRTAVRWMVLGTATLALACGASKKIDAMKAQAAREAATDTGPAVTAAEVPTPAAAQAPRAENEVMKPRYHPASRERDYALKRANEIAATPEDLALLELMGEPMKGEKAFNQIKKAGKTKYALVRESLRCTNREVRMQAATILAILKDSSVETTQALGDAVLLDPDPDVRAQSAKAFIAVRSPGVADILIRSLNEDPFEGARSNAAWALGDIGARNAIPHLRKATNDADTYVRLRSVSALKKMKAREAVPELIERLADSSPMVRERARETLREVTGVDRGDDPAKWKGVK